MRAYADPRLPDLSTPDLGRRDFMDHFISADGAVVTLKGVIIPRSQIDYPRLLGGVPVYPSESQKVLSANLFLILLSAV